MSPVSLLAAAEPAATQPSIGTPTLWAITIGAIAVLFVVDFLITRRPHEVSMKEAVGWSAFYVAIPVGFGVLDLAAVRRRPRRWSTTPATSSRSRCRSTTCSSSCCC